jgi:hypothetical protein
MLVTGDFGYQATALKTPVNASLQRLSQPDAINKISKPAMQAVSNG